MSQTKREIRWNEIRTRTRADKTSFYRTWFFCLKFPELEELYQLWVRQQEEKNVMATTMKSEDFYKTTAWRQTRYKFLKSIPNKMCFVCRGRNKEFHVDHHKPRWLFPELAFDFSNLKLLCKECNLAKGGFVIPNHESRVKVIRRSKGENI